MIIVEIANMVIKQLVIFPSNSSLDHTACKLFLDMYYLAALMDRLFFKEMVRNILE